MSLSQDPAYFLFDILSTPHSTLEELTFGEGQGAVDSAAFVKGAYTISLVVFQLLQRRFRAKLPALKRLGLLDLSFTSRSFWDSIMGCDWNEHFDVPGLGILDTEGRLQGQVPIC